jgi:phosphoenolpyruvate carboxykinase (GTP)
VSDYFQHWLNIGQNMGQAGAKLPGIYCVNWFRKDADGKFVWPGYGENMRVLKWMIERIEGKTMGVDNGFGISPAFDEITWTGLEFSKAQFAIVTSLDKADWKAEIALHTELFKQLAYHLPAQLESTKAQLEQRLAA